MIQLELEPVKGLEVKAPISSECFDLQRKATRQLGLPGVAGTARLPRLAIVGSGLSIEKALPELLAWDGEIWAINGAWNWLASRNIPATFFTIDPTESIISLAKGAKDLILHAQVRSEVYQNALALQAKIRVFDPNFHVGGYSALGAAFAAIDAGFKEASFFGCECSHEINRVHIHSNELFAAPIVVSVLEKNFLTRAVYYHQCLELSQIIRAQPQYFKERSGGMLRAMVELPDEPGNIPA